MEEQPIFFLWFHLLLNNIKVPFQNLDRALTVEQYLDFFLHWALKYIYELEPVFPALTPVESESAHRMRCVPYEISEFLDPA